MQDVLILRESEEYKAAASRLLSEARILPILERWGTVEIVGSYAASLMMSGDIDIEVVGGPYHKESMAEVMHSLICLGYFDRIRYQDIRFFETYTGTFPRGHYIGPRKKYRNEDWSIDIWFFAPEELIRQTERDRLQISKEDPTEEERKIILWGKKQVRLHNLPGASQVIYHAVLREGVVTQEALTRYLNLPT